jgi:hypothetical protein
MTIGNSFAVQFRCRKTVHILFWSPAQGPGGNNITARAAYLYVDLGSGSARKRASASPQMCHSKRALCAPVSLTNFGSF